MLQIVLVASVAAIDRDCRESVVVEGVLVQAGMIGVCFRLCKLFELHLVSCDSDCRRESFGEGVRVQHLTVIC